MTNETAKKSICLNMIVKNESAVIERCLKSIKDKIDYWVIVDTGSSDDTQKIIKKCLKGTPGELIERPWVNFGYNRNEAFELAKDKADYLLLLDADEVVQSENKKGFSDLSKPYYFISSQDSEGKPGLSKLLLVQSTLNWQWQGSVHESLKCPDQTLDQSQVMPGATLISKNDGFRAKDAQKYLKDAQMLENTLKMNPNSPTDQFMLGYSYFKAGELVLALKAFEHRLSMHGDKDEMWYAFYSVARLHDALGYKSEVVTKELCLAYQGRPKRREPLAILAAHHLRQGNLPVDFSVAYQALQIKKPEDSIYVEEEFYTYQTLAIYADCAHLLGMKKQALELYNILNNMQELPSSMKENVEKIVKKLRTCLHNCD